MLRCIADSRLPTAPVAEHRRPAANGFAPGSVRPVSIQMTTARQLATRVAEDVAQDRRGSGDPLPAGGCAGARDGVRVGHGGAPVCRAAGRPHRRRGGTARRRRRARPTRARRSGCHRGPPAPRERLLQRSGRAGLASPARRAHPRCASVAARAGLVVAPGNPLGIRGVADLARRRLEWRAPGTASRLCSGGCRARRGSTRRRGPEEAFDSHLGSSQLSRPELPTPACAVRGRPRRWARVDPHRRAAVRAGTAAAARRASGRARRGVPRSVPGRRRAGARCAHDDRGPRGRTALRRRSGWPTAWRCWFRERSGSSPRRRC